MRKKNLEEDHGDHRGEGSETNLSPLDQVKGNKSAQSNELNTGHPKPENWPYDADSIDTDQNLNADAHRDPHPQTDGEFPAHGQTGPNPTIPGRAPGLSP